MKSYLAKQHILSKTWAIIIGKVVLAVLQQQCGLLRKGDHYSDGDSDARILSGSIPSSP
jgi:hypothetical protein